MAMAGSYLLEHIMATLTPPGGKPMWMLARKGNWPELEHRLKASKVEDLWVVDGSSEVCLAVVKAAFDRHGDDDDPREKLLHVLHVLGRQVEPDVDNVELLRRLLALGIDVNAEGPKCFTPSYCIGTWGLVRCAEALCFCRPDLSKRGRCNHETPVESVRWRVENEEMSPEKRADFVKIADMFDNFMRNGFPSLGQLACEEKWYAVKNLCRRSAVDVEEFRREYRGKDAIQWAEYHHQHQLAEEMRYFFQYLLDEDDEQVITLVKNITLQETVAVKGPRATVLEDQFEDPTSSVKAKLPGDPVETVELPAQVWLDEISGGMEEIGDLVGANSEPHGSCGSKAVEASEEPIVTVLESSNDGVREEALASVPEVEAVEELTE